VTFVAIAWPIAGSGSLRYPLLRHPSSNFGLRSLCRPHLGGPYLEKSASLRHSTLLEKIWTPWRWDLIICAYIVQILSGDKFRISAFSLRNDRLYALGRTRQLDMEPQRISGRLLRFFIARGLLVMTRRGSTGHPQRWGRVSHGGIARRLGLFTHEGFHRAHYHQLSSSIVAISLRSECFVQFNLHRASGSVHGQEPRGPEASAGRGA